MSSISSEYAAGGIEQHMGYVVSGTTQDGIYLEVCDLGDGKTNDGTRNSCQAQTAYKLNTPPGRPSGWCVANFANSRVQGPSANGQSCVYRGQPPAGAGLLKDPLWYAAKYGVPAGIPSIDTQGNPLNYFLVTNANKLKSQLDNAFSNIIANSQPTASVATSTPRYVNGATLAYEASFDGKDWTGDLKAYRIKSDGVYTGVPPVWKASDKLPTPASRKIFTSKPQTGAFTGQGIEFTKNTTTGLPTAMQTKLMAGLDAAQYKLDDVLAYLRGDQSKEQNQTPPGPYRTRGSRIGDVLNSSPAVAAVTSYGYGQILSGNRRHGGGKVRRVRGAEEDLLRQQVREAGGVLRCQRRHAARDQWQRDR